MLRSPVEVSLVAARRWFMRYNQSQMKANRFDSSLVGAKSSRTRRKLEFPTINHFRVLTEGGDTLI